jgi:hypothetical protein
MSGGGSQTTTTTATPWAGAQPYLEQLLGQAADVAGQDIDYAKPYVGMSDEQRNLLEQLQGYYAPEGQYAQSVAQQQDVISQMLQAPGQVATDPVVQSLVEQAQKGLGTQLTETVLPQIRSGATAAGQYGSTRQGVAEGVAAGKTAEAQSQAATSIYGQAYQDALRRQMQGLAMAPQVSEMGKAGIQTGLQIQDVLRGEETGAAEAEYARRTQAPWAGLEKWASLLYPAAGMGGTTTATGPGRGMFSRLLGGATTGLGAYSALAGMGGKAAGMATPAGMGLGLLSLLA